jgi:uncharacterized membrane protein
MKTILIIIISLAGLLGLLLGIAALIGSRLPIAHVATRSILLHRPSDEVYKLVRDVDKSPTWRPDVKSVDLLGEPNGKLNYREHGKQGDVTYELTEDVAGERIVTRILDQDLGYSGTWTIVFTPESGGTRVRITENGEVSNLMFRFMSRYIFGHSSTIDGYLTSLAKHFGEGARIED